MDLEINVKERIGFGKRLIAYIIDMILSTILGFIISFSFGKSLVDFFYESSEINEIIITFEKFENILPGISNFIKIFFEVGSVIALIGFLIMFLEAMTGQTPGKMFLGIKNGNQDGSNATTTTLLVRTLIKNISSVLSLIAVILSVTILGNIGSFLGFIIFIGCFFTLGDSKQSIHDMIAKTAVYNKSELN
jgi:uncharacterized RDD family membrane protein YckC